MARKPLFLGPNRQKITQIIAKNVKWGRRGVVLFAVIGVLFYWINSQLRSPQKLPIRTVEVVGEFRYLDEATLQADLLPYASGGFFTVDVQTIQQQVQADPWVAKVAVRRIWPDTLRLQLQEQQPQARWRDMALFNAQGALFTPDAMGVVRHLPLLVAPEAQQEQVWDYFLTLSEVFSEAELTIEQLTLAERGTWQCELDNGVTLMLGKQDIILRAHRFLAWFAETAPVQQIQYADLRYTNGLAIGWKNKHGEETSR